MSDKTHERLEQLKKLLNFTDETTFHFYGCGYQQAESDCFNEIEQLRSLLSEAREMAERIVNDELGTSVVRARDAAAFLSKLEGLGE